MAINCDPLEKNGIRGKKCVAVGKFIPDKLLLRSWMGFGARKEGNFVGDNSHRDTEQKSIK